MEKQDKVVYERACQGRYNAADQDRDIDKAGQDNDPTDYSRESQREQNLL